MLKMTRLLQLLHHDKFVNCKLKIKVVVCVEVKIEICLVRAVKIEQSPAKMIIVSPYLSPHASSHGIKAANPAASAAVLLLSNECYC